MQVEAERIQQESEAAAKLQAEETAKREAEAEAKAKRDAEEKTKREAEAQAKREAEEKAKREAEAKREAMREEEARALAAAVEAGDAIQFTTPMQALVTLRLSDGRLTLSVKREGEGENTWEGLRCVELSNTGSTTLCVAGIDIGTPSDATERDTMLEELLQLATRASVTLTGFDGVKGFEAHAAQPYVQAAKREAEEKATHEAEKNARREAEEKAAQEAEAAAKREAEEKAKREAAERARQEAEEAVEEQRRRALAEQKACAERPSAEEAARQEAAERAWRASCCGQIQLLLCNPQEFAYQQLHDEQPSDEVRTNESKELEARADEVKTDMRGKGFVPVTQKDMQATPGVIDSTEMKRAGGAGTISHSSQNRARNLLARPT